MKRLITIRRVILVGAFLVIGIPIWLPLVSSAIAAATMPTEARDCNFSGTWRSDAYWGIGGALKATMPDPIPKNIPFEIKAYIFYNPTSVFRTAQWIPMTLEGLVTEKRSSTGSNSDTPIVAADQLTFTFKGGDGPNSQIVKYHSASDPNFRRLSGGYASSDPFDIGTFTLRKKK
jgi:hypothetical protein